MPSAGWMHSGFHGMPLSPRRWVWTGHMPACIKKVSPRRGHLTWVFMVWAAWCHNCCCQSEIWLADDHCVEPRYHMERLGFCSFSQSAFASSKSRALCPLVHIWEQPGKFRLGKKKTSAALRKLLNPGIQKKCTGFRNAAGYLTVFGWQDVLAKGDLYCRSFTNCYSIVLG